MSIATITALIAAGVLLLYIVYRLRLIPVLFEILTEGL